MLKFSVGMFIEPTIEKESGIRREFTEEERLITEKLMKRTETIGLNGSHLSVDRGQCMLPSLFFILLIVFLNYIVVHILSSSNLLKELWFYKKSLFIDYS